MMVSLLLNKKLQGKEYVKKQCKQKEPLWLLFKFDYFYYMSKLLKHEVYLPFPYLTTALLQG